MKKTLSILLVCLMIVSMFAACSGGSSNPVGKYVVKTINGKSAEDYLNEEISDSGMKLEDVAGMIGLDMSKLNEMVTFDLQEGGKAVVASGMMDLNEEGTWKLEGTKLTITIDGDAQAFEFKNGEIIGDMGSEMNLVMAKAK